MIRVIQIAGDGSAIESTGIDALKNCHEGVLCWIDLEAFDENELRLLQQRFGLHPLAIQDCTDAQRAKLTEYDNYLFVILNSMSLPNPLKTPKIAELAVFLGTRFLLTVHREKIGAVDEIWQRALADPHDTFQGADRLLYNVIDSLMDEIFPIIDRLSDSLLEVENSIVRRSDKKELPDC